MERFEFINSQAIREHFGRDRDRDRHVNLVLRFAVPVVPEERGMA